MNAKQKKLDARVRKLVGYVVREHNRGRRLGLVSVCAPMFPVRLVNEAERRGLIRIVGIWKNSARAVSPTKLGEELVDVAR